MKNSLKTALSLGLVTAVGAGGVAMVANAKSNPSVATIEVSKASPQERPIAQVDDQVNEDIEDDTNEGPDNEDEQEMAQYQSLAKITADQAKQIAEAAQGAMATEVELDEEDGSLVYEVKFANAEVLVDAGTGEILHTELRGQAENDATEVPIQGSIQVPDNDGEQGENRR